jgi:hypothetical protein
MHTPGPQFNKEQNVQCLQPERLNREEIAGKRLLLIVAQEGTPVARRLPLSGRCNSVLLKHVVYC